MDDIGYSKISKKISPFSINYINKFYDKRFKQFLIFLTRRSHSVSWIVWYFRRQTIVSSISQHGTAKIFWENFHASLTEFKYVWLLLHLFLLINYHLNSDHFIEKIKIYYFSPILQVNVSKIVEPIIMTINFLIHNLQMLRFSMKINIMVQMKIFFSEEPNCA